MRTKDKEPSLLCEPHLQLPTTLRTDTEFTSEGRADTQHVLGDKK